MESASEVGCVLKVNIQCEACQMKLLEILRSISGVYSVTLDAEEGLAKISGEMDPNILLWALARNGKHAELKWVSLKSTTPKKGYYNYNNGYHSDSYNGYSYGHQINPTETEGRYPKDHGMTHTKAIVRRAASTTPTTRTTAICRRMALITVADFY
ncbi:hypothetical protein Acr_00g0094350 [Actinidia rufa]|uniref:HMA domain-containing protein n=1 Tax=Actinidia rufa TaxID=165716 RepID=A0A7J0DYD6_9ERIC|nr:hypothetical protein Acr_00g0094350 [Actinidia rufa]